MLIVITTAGLSIVLFLCAFLGFKAGLRLGMQTAKGAEPEKIRSPVQVVKDTIKEVKQIKLEHEQEKEEKKYASDLEKLMNYTGDIEDEE